MSPLRITVFFGSVREGRFGIRAAKFIVNILKARNHHVTLIDPEEKPLPLLKKPLYHYQNPKDGPQMMQDINDEIVKSDAFVVVSAEYNHSIPPALSNTMDHFAIASYKHKPCGIVTYSYGNFGGVRASMQLRCFLGELGMVTPQFIFAIPKVQEAFSESGEPQNDYMIKNGETLIKELEWFGEALKAQREKNGVPT